MLGDHEDLEAHEIQQELARPSLPRTMDVEEPETTDAPTTARPTRWQRLPAPSADAVARARAPATSNLPERMIDSGCESWVRFPFQWLEFGARPDPADVYEFLNVLVPCIHGLNHTGVALASQTLGCTQVPDEFKDFRALQCPIYTAARACTCTKICLLVSYAARPDFHTREPSRETPPTRAGPRLHFMTMVCAVLHGVATGCLGPEYAEGLFKAMHVSHAEIVKNWFENPRDETETTHLPLDLLALIWAASACLWCIAL